MCEKCVGAIYMCEKYVRKMCRGLHVWVMDSLSNDPCLGWLHTESMAAYWLSNSGNSGVCKIKRGVAPLV